MNDNDFLRSIQQQVENEFLAQEQIYSQIRKTGEEAPAKILSMMDTGVRIGDNASMLRFNLEVFPKDPAHPSAQRHRMPYPICRGPSLSRVLRFT